MGVAQGPRPLGTSIYQRASWLWRGYKPSDIRIGFQVAAGWACLLGVYASSASWDRLSELGAGPTLVFILYTGLCQTVTGATNVGMVLASLAAVLCSALAFIPVSLAFAAGGGTGGSDTTAKAILMVASAAVLAGLLAVARMRFPVLDLFFYYVAYLTSTIAFAYYWQLTPFGLEALPAIQGSMGYSLLLSVALAVAVAIPVTWLVALPAGRLVRKMTCGSLSSLGRLTAEVVELIVTPSQPGNPKGVGSAGSGTEGGPSAKLHAELDAELAAKAQQELVALQQCLQKLPLMLLATKAELDLYAAQKRFPSKAFSAITDRIDAAATCLGLVLRPLAREAAPQDELLEVQLPPVLPMDFSACRAAAAQFQAVQQALTGCCDALAGVLGEAAPMAKALEQLQELERSSAELSKTLHDQGGASRSALSLRTLFGLLRAVGLQVRCMYRPAAEAVEQLQPGAVELVDAHFKSSIWARYTQPEEPATLQQDGEQALLAAAAPGQNTSPTRQASEVAAPPSAAATNGNQDAAQHATGGDAVLDIPQATLPAAAAADVAGSGQPAGRAVAPQPASPTTSLEPLVDRPCSEAAGSPRSWLSRAGLGPAQLRPGLQLAVGMAIAGTLVVVFRVFESLDYKSVWIVMTVNAVFERCVGDLRLKSFNRFLGTALGMLWACACIGFSYLANGSSWDNTPAKYATMACLVTLWGFFIGSNRNRSPRYSYSWSVMSSTVCVVVLEGFKDERTPWKYASYRLACVSIGLAIELLVSSSVLPVTVDQIQRQELKGGLEGLALLVDQVAALHAERVALGSEEQRAAAAKRLKATQKKVRTAALRMDKLEENARLELDKWWPAGPSGSSGGGGSSSRGRHLAVESVCNYLLQLRDLFIAVAQVQLSLAATHIRPLTTPAYMQLSLAVADQVAESLRALSLVVSGVLPMSRALRALEALDALLSQLTAEAAAALKQEEVSFSQEQLQAADEPGEAGSGAAALLGSSRRRPAFMFAAAGLSSARLLRRLYHAAAVAMLPTDTAAIQAAEESLRAQAEAPRAKAKAAVEQAAVVAALSMHAREGVVGEEEEEVGLKVKGQDAT